MDGKPKGWLRVDECPHIVQQWLYPPTCLLCDAPGHNGLDLCLGCLDSLPYSHGACPRCAIALPAEAPLATPCGRCQKKPPFFDAATSLFRYEEPVRHLLHAFKFGRRYACARLLGELLAARLARLPEYPQLIIPVPLHPKRYAERGFNQSLELARPLSRRLGVPLDSQHCRRVRFTPPQSQLSALQRRRNLRGAFQITGSIPADYVAILDDIVTTGATVGEMARALKGAGVKRVDVWCCARA